MSFPCFANKRQPSTTPSSSSLSCGWLFLKLGKFGQEKVPPGARDLSKTNSGAQIVFRSFIQPVFSRFFSQSGSTAANLRSQADQATKPHAM